MGDLVRLGALFVSLMLLSGLLATPTSAASASGLGAAPSAVVAAKARPRATVAGSYLPLSTGKVRVVLTSNVTKVTVYYRTAKNKKRSLTMRVSAGSAATTLPAGSKKIDAKAKASSKLRASKRVALALLKPPAGLTAAAGTNSVSLRWSAAPGVTRWQVFQSTSLGGGWKRATPGQVGVPRARLSSLPAGKRIYFAVAAMAGGARTGLSRPVAATPKAPLPRTPAPVVTELTAVEVTSSSVRLAWPATLKSPVLRRAAGPIAPTGPAKGIAVPVTGNQARDSGLAADRDYSYALFAGNRRATLTVHTAGSSGSYAVGADTLLAKADQVAAAAPATPLDGVAAATVKLSRGTPAPAVGGHVVLPPSSGLPGGFIGEVSKSDPSGALTLRQASLDDVFSQLSVDVSESLDIPDIVLSPSDVVSSATQTGGTTLRSQASGAPLITCDSSMKWGVEPLRVEFSDAHAVFSFEKGFQAGKHVLDPPVAWARVRQGVDFNVTTSLVAEVGAAPIKCKLAPALMSRFRFAKTVMAGVVPILILIEPALELEIGGKADVAEWKTRTKVKAGFTMQGQLGVMAPPTLAWPDLGFSNFHNDGLKVLGFNTPVAGEAFASAKFVGTLTVGPGAGTTEAGAVAGLVGELSVGPKLTLPVPLPNPVCVTSTLENGLKLGASAKVYVTDWGVDWTVKPVELGLPPRELGKWCWPSAGTEPAHPGKPTLTAGDKQISAVWSAPTSTGGNPITGYTATATPGARQCSTTGELTCTITGLTNGTRYSVVVAARNRVGTSAQSAAASAVPGPAAQPAITLTPTSIGAWNSDACRFTPPFATSFAIHATGFHPGAQIGGIGLVEGGMAWIGTGHMVRPDGTYDFDSLSVERPSASYTVEVTDDRGARATAKLDVLPTSCARQVSQTGDSATVVVAGAGFRRGEMVGVLVNQTPAASGAAEFNGSFSTSTALTCPTSGNWDITVIGQQSGIQISFRAGCGLGTASQKDLPAPRAGIAALRG